MAIICMEAGLRKSRIKTGIKILYTQMERCGKYFNYIDYLLMEQV